MHLERVERAEKSASAAEMASEKKKMISTGGLLILPFLFGMNLTVIQHIGNKMVKSEKGEIPMSSVNEWGYITASMFVGAFLFSASLFILGLRKKSANGKFREIFTSAGVIFAIANFTIPATSNIFLLSAARVISGVASGITCSLCSVYYICMHNEKKGTKICMWHGLLISMGVMAQGRLTSIFHASQTYWIFYIMTLLACISASISFFNVQNVKNTEKEIRTALISDRPQNEEKTDRKTIMLILACLMVHILQQLTGINPLLSFPDKLIFLGEESTMKRIAKVFFDFSGLLGALLGSVLFGFFPKRLSTILLISSFFTGAAFIPFFVNNQDLMSWGGGVYYFSFSIAIAGLPWALPSLLLTEGKDIALAAGLGALFNWAITGLLIFKFDSIKSVLGNNIFGVFMCSSLLAGVFGWWLLNSYGKKETPKQETRTSVESIQLSSRVSASSA
ncbi:hypothetical protein NEFER03_0569 [Nematocida sp. LUAm3]|nr:hypothetical protein NEFER03_0569 [Nematocida sp. LUAm3]KAI5175536.1 hypothetical protein NEFER02_1442 [Nematocida sp. LUAm2]KAI5178434.1 hypothetical protein NEFER01_1581 [Nematocida sp. LUAm1]